MSIWEHAFDWALEHAPAGRAFEYAEWYVSEYPDGDGSHSLALSRFIDQDQE